MRCRRPCGPLGGRGCTRKVPCMIDQGCKGILLYDMKCSPVVPTVVTQSAPRRLTFCFCWNPVLLNVDIAGRNAPAPGSRDSWLSSSYVHTSAKKAGISTDQWRMHRSFSQSSRSDLWATAKSVLLSLAAREVLRNHLFSSFKLHRREPDVFPVSARLLRQRGLIPPPPERATAGGKHGRTYRALAPSVLRSLRVRPFGRLASSTRYCS